MLTDQAGDDELTPRFVERSADEAAQAVMAYALRTRGDGFYDLAWQAFWGDDTGRFVDDSPFTELIIPWALHVRDPESADPAQTVAQQFLASSSSRQVSQRSRDYIEACSSAPLSFWQIDAVQSGLGMSMRNLLDGRELFVHESLASTTITPGEIMLGQVVEVDGTHILSISGPYSLPAIPCRSQLEAVLNEAVDSESGPWSDLELIDVYLDCVEKGSQPPDVRNTEGDRLEWTTSTFVFDPAERGRLLGRLDQLRNIDGVGGEPGGPEAYVWVSQRKGGTMENVTRASIEVHADHLVTECNSRKRDRLLRARLQKNLGDLLELDETTYGPMDLDAFESETAPEGESLDLDALPPADRAHLTQMLDDVHMRWADQSVPALGGQTPREAVRNEIGRRQVARLLDDFENQQQRSSESKHAFDYDKLRRELGLTT